METGQAEGCTYSWRLKKGEAAGETGQSPGVWCPETRERRVEETRTTATGPEEGAAQGLGSGRDPGATEVELQQDGKSGAGGDLAAVSERGGHSRFHLQGNDLEDWERPV